MGRTDLSFPPKEYLLGEMNEGWVPTTNHQLVCLLDSPSAMLQSSQEEIGFKSVKRTAFPGDLPASS